MEKSRIADVVRISAHRAQAGRPNRPLMLWGDGAEEAMWDLASAEGVDVMRVSGAADPDVATAVRRACLARSGVAAPDADLSLGALLDAVARDARAAGQPLLVLADGLGDADLGALGDLIGALHAAAQSRAPLVFVGNGGPDAHRRCGDARDYAEMLFTFAAVSAEPGQQP